MNPANFKKLAEQIAVGDHHLRYLLAQLKLYIPEATIWAFGSRVRGSHRAVSDLDLAVICDKETAKKELPKLNEVFIESDLPFRVQLLDFNRLPENMRENIKKNYVVLYHPQEKPMESVSNVTLNELAAELKDMLINEKAESDDIFHALREKLLRVGSGVKIQIYPRDHNPPHFHVETGNKSASFDIQTGQLMQGNLGHTANKVVQQFYKDNQQMLMNIWNNTRPGIISEGACYIFN